MARRTSILIYLSLVALVAGPTTIYGQAAGPLTSPGSTAPGTATQPMPPAAHDNMAPRPMSHPMGGTSPAGSPATTSPMAMGSTVQALAGVTKAITKRNAMEAYSWIERAEVSRLNDLGLSTAAPTSDGVLQALSQAREAVHHNHWTEAQANINTAAHAAGG